MSELKIIGWFIWLAFSIMLVFDVVGFRALCNFFPEGKRWWHIHAQLASLVFFALAVLCNPWTS